MIITYKGFSITISEDKNAHSEYRYVAYINDVANG